MIKQESIFKELEQERGFIYAQSIYLDDIRPALVLALQSYGFQIIYTDTRKVYGYLYEWEIEIAFDKVITIELIHNFQCVNQFLYLYDEYIDISSIISTYTPFKGISPEYHLDRFFKQFQELGIEATLKNNKIVAFDKNITYIVSMSKHYPRGQIEIFVGQNCLGISSNLGRISMKDRIKQYDELYN